MRINGQPNFLSQPFQNHRRKVTLLYIIRYPVAILLAELSFVPQQGDEGFVNAVSSGGQ
ncbi:hypothetical protein DPMN_152108 [Dreissena polymorpha]|uniref:Uncharacterized protein n=1 Tax=Dreissena polymorpha TaxID=45954 RepID=A0A9D4FJT0_DREPO|nr:hypothetical protein DPMN_152108 [Dreissena polymorpha]